MMSSFAQSRYRFAFPVIATAAACLAGTASARADLKVVSRQSGNMPGNTGNGQTQTTYYKGNKIRSESSRQVVILDGDAQKIYILNPAGKTYLSRPLAMAGPMGGLLAMLDMKTVATVTPLGKTRVIAGKPTKGYAFKATVSMSMKPGAMPNAPKGTAPQKVGTLQISGEHWTTEAIKLPGSSSGMQSYMRLARAMSGDVPGMKDLVEKMGQVKGFPLASSQKIVTSGGPGGAGPGAGRAFQMSTEAISISEAPLSAALFTVPAGYKQQQMPSPGMRPGMPPVPRK